MNRNQLWNVRFKERLKEMLRYGRYIFNDHLLIVLLFAIGGGAYYYKDWVTTLDETFPTAGFFAVIFSILLTNGTVITFLKEADKVFLLPLETNLTNYFIRSYILTVLWRLYMTFIVLLILIPVYLHTTGTQKALLVFCVLLVFLQILNLYTRWKVDYDMDQASVAWDLAVRLLLNGLLVFFYINKKYALFAIIFIIFFIYAAYFHNKMKSSVLPWERLILNEERRMAFFYRVANLFTDVPQLRNRTKRRKWADMFMKSRHWTQRNTYSFLFVRTFFRSGDYFGLYIRLTVIAALLIWGLNGSYVAFVIAILFIYLTGFQLISLWKHYDAVIWSDLYPVDDDIKKKAFLKIMLNILWTQNLIFTVCFITSLEFQRGILLFLVLSGFCTAFVFLYCKKRIEKLD